MDAGNTASQALIEALKAPGLTPEHRRALLDALQALHAPAVPAATSAGAPAATSAPGPSPEPKARRPQPVAPVRRAQSLKLTREAIAAMTLPEGKVEDYIFDSVCPQLAVRLRVGGAKTYMVVMWDSERSRTVKETLGKTGRLTPEQARGKAQALVAAVSDGQDVRRPPVNSLTLGKLVEQWHAAKSMAKMRTADEMRSIVLDHLGALAHRPVHEIEREQIGAVHHHIATQARRRVQRRIDGELRTIEIGERGLPATADKWLACMSSVFGWACTNALAPENPCRGIQKAFDAKGAARTTYLHGDTLLRFWKALLADSDADVRDVLLIALYSGQRKGNVLSMKWDHLDLAVGLWSIPGDQTKQKEPQTNPLSAQVREILARRREDASTEWVFPAVRASADKKLRHMSESRPRDAWERITRAANIEGLRIHDLRHTAGSWLARLGSNTAVRQKALGHRTSAMAERYAHLELDPVADAMQRMGDAIEAAATKKAARVSNIKARRT